MYKEYNISKTFQRTFAAEFVMSSLGLDTIQQTSKENDNVIMSLLNNLSYYVCTIAQG